MAVSMLALLRLSLLAVLFGGGLALLFGVLRFLFRLLLPLPPPLREKLALRLPALAVPTRQRGRRRYRGFLRFWADLVAVLFSVIAFSVFLFWQGNGEVRFFVILSALIGGGAVAACLRRLAPLEDRLLLMLRYLLLLLLRPVWGLLLRIGHLFRSFLAKAASVFIKTFQRQYTNHVSKRYMKRAPRRITGRRMRTALADACRHSGKGEA